MIFIECVINPAAIALRNPDTICRNALPFCDGAHVRSGRRAQPHEPWLDFKGTDIVSNNSPLESLAAFAIVFVAGVLATTALGKYINKVKRDARACVS